jgi:hypothetical protein
MKAIGNLNIETQPDNKATTMSEDDTKSLFDAIA